LEVDLRPYQAAGIGAIREHFKNEKRKVLLWLATGGGKTHCFSYMMIEAMNKGRRCLMIVRGRKLVDQASKRLFREGVTHGVMMSGHWNFRPHAPIQICSIDTLIARNWRPKADLIVIDEAHQAVSDGYREFLKDYPKAFIVAVTATPYSNKSLRHIADEIVHPITVQELIDTGYLVNARYYAPSTPDVSGVKISKQTGDYVQDQLAALMDKSSITGDIISHWKKLAENRPTICFAVSVEHSKHIAEQFRQAGIAAEHCDADTPEKERDAIIKRIEAGVTKVVTNVGIFCTGVDIPPVSCIIQGRPTKSYILYIQQAGRGTRTFPGKKDFLLLDHAGNVHRHGFIVDEPEPNLDGKRTSGGMNSRARTCGQCFAIVEEFPCTAEQVDRDADGNAILDDMGNAVWRQCGWAPVREETGPREILQVDGELKEITGPSPLQRYDCERFCEEEIEKCVKKGVNIWRAYYKTIEMYGDQAARLVFFRLCKRHGITLERKRKQEGSDGVPFK
jgi:DNA repair protein RadD